MDNVKRERRVLQRQSRYRTVAIKRSRGTSPTRHNFSNPKLIKSFQIISNAPLLPHIRFHVRVHLIAAKAVSERIGCENTCWYIVQVKDSSTPYRLLKKVIAPWHPTPLLPRPCPSIFSAVFASSSFPPRMLNPCQGLVGFPSIQCNTPTQHCLPSSLPLQTKPRLHHELRISLPFCAFIGPPLIPPVEKDFT
ncbi:uncharacterized protein EI97DRAFT_107571 [Westerdykella ornata]|uniref:Uncharacterized protein n=1 Tax=Westerdykella ornata TaxID=318751 RepID=A0A6A6JTP5_WESOR|nr:uncharacterized protein EI97DRAFT_107571 [Westerdykella ornata]KAF2280000.1 hypothetical protein EI97DRAFT_107571 [Westerdykella ornata]